MTTATKTHPIVRERDASRARFPDEEGYADHDGVRLLFEIYGNGQPTIVLVPSTPIVQGFSFALSTRAKVPLFVPSVHSVTRRCIARS